MKLENKLILLIVILVILISSCSNKNNTKKNNQELEFPKRIDLTYKEIDLEELKVDYSITSTEILKSIKIGKISNNDIDIKLYVANNEGIVNGVFTHKSKNYILKDLGYSHDIDSIQIYNIQKTYNNKKIVLVSAIGSHIFGYKFLFYSEYDDKWYLYHNWGTPKAYDINNDNIYEILLQFEGLHNNFPDLNILRWNEDKFEVSSINNDILKHIKVDGSSIKLSSTYEEEKDKIIVAVSTIRKEKTNTVNYILNTEELVKFQ